jgi:hypothetical protein
LICRIIQHQLLPKNIIIKSKLKWMESIAICSAKSDDFFYPVGNKKIVDVENNPGPNPSSHRQTADGRRPR